MTPKCYVCPYCGKVIVQMVEAPTDTVCCGHPMKEMPVQTSGTSEKAHVPIVTRPNAYTLQVNVGAEPHPMTEGHHVRFVLTETEHGWQVYYLQPTDSPEVCVCDSCDHAKAVYEYCNLHGLWKTNHVPKPEKKGCGTGGKKSCRNLLLMLCCMIFPWTSCTPKSVIDNTPVPAMDLNRYLGKWYELARFDHRFERGLDNCTATYTLKDDGTIRVLNAGIKDGKRSESEGKAKTTGTPGLLRVSFFGPFYSDYRVLMLSEDYSYALVGSGSDKYLWILSRTPDLPEATMQNILREAVRRGYNTANLIWVDQGLSRSK